MILKHSVKFGSPTLAVVAGWIVCEEVFSELGYKFTITSFNDSVHNIGSLHTSDLAWDCRTTSQGMDNENIDKAVKLLKERLTKDFDVVKESNHIHIEFDRK